VFRFMNSLVAPPFIDPHRTFVEVRRNAQQRAAEKIKAEPKNADTQGEMDYRQHPREGAARFVRLDGQLAQAVGANHAVIVLGDAFAAVKVAAFRAACDGFAKRMLEATLMNEGGHYRISAGWAGGTVIMTICSGVVSP
jgi:hypothetical protein